MKGRLHRLALTTLLTVVVVPLASCSDGGVQYPTVNFVGNASCPTKDAQPYSPAPPHVNGDKIVGQAVDEMPHTHIAPPAKVQYDHNPPTSGCHYSLGGNNPAPIQPGVYDQEIDAEYWVHNLEHGYVVVLYNCPTGCADVIQQLVTWRKSLPPDPGAASQQAGLIKYAKAVVLPWHSMPVKFAAVSWDYYQGWNTFDLNAIKAFYDNHVGHSPEGLTSQ
jgi:hypothetical protein